VLKVAESEEEEEELANQERPLGSNEENPDAEATQKVNQRLS